MTATRKKCLGVDLGSNTVKLVELGIDKSGVKVLTVASAETNVEPSMPADERRAAVARTLRDLLKRNKVSTKEAIFAIPGQKVFIRRFRLPDTTDERLEKIVAYEARQQIPFPLDKTDLQWQFFRIPEDNEVEVLLVAVRHDEIAEFMALADKTGLDARAVSVSSFALFGAQAFLARPAASILEQLTAISGVKKKPGKKAKKGAPEGEEPAEDTEMSLEDMAFEEVKGYVNIGAAAMDLAISQQGKQTLLKFCRSVPSAGNEITRSIMESCSVTSFQDAERIKKHQSKLMTFDFDFDVDPNINQEACVAATQTVDRVVSELRRSLDFFISQPDGMAVDALVLSGGQAQLAGMDAYIEEKLTIPVVVSREPAEGSGLAWPSSAGPMTPYVVAIGLALQGVGLSDVAVDFLPEERKITRDFPYRTVAIMGVLLLLILFIAAQAGKTYAQKFQTEQIALQGQLEQRSEADRLSNEVQAKHIEVARLYEEFKKGVGERDYWMKFLADMAAVKPPDVLVDQINLGQDGTVRIIGICSQRGTAATFSRALQDMLEGRDPLQKPELKDLVEISDPRYEGRVFRFELGLQTGDKILRIPPPQPTAGSGSGNRGGGN